VAIYHLSAKVIGRSGGHSAIASAAYRAAECLHDQKLDREHDYTAKAGVVYSEILLPDGAPERWLIRETLWNEVEAGEKRKDAQLARDIEISLPRELGRAEAIRLAKDFVREQFVDRGMVADLNVHWTRAADGELQPHAHVMLTMREVVPGRNGHLEEGGFGKKVVAWNDRALLGTWRERWASFANERLAEQGHDVRIDHRSHVEQGIKLEPQNKIGPAGMRREHRGEDAERAAEHVEISRRNGERIIAEPAIVLDAITRQQSTFTRRDLARFVSRHTVDAEQFELAMTKAEASPELVRLGVDGRGRERFTTREMLDTERTMERAAASIGGESRHRVLQAAGSRALAVAEQGGLVLGAEQQAAYRHVTSGPDLALVVGYAGTGKSAMLGVARAAWEADGYTIRGAALSGIAAEGLEGGSGIASRTLASLEFAWKDGRDQLTSRDVLVVDEAGLVGSRQMARVLSAAEAAGAKVVLVGDAEQLQAIEAGAAFRALAERHGAAEISEVRRQRAEWQRSATRELATARTEAALERFERAGMVHGHATQQAARAALVDGWNRVRRHSPNASQMILAYTRADVVALNGLARERLRAASDLGPDQVVQTERGERAFASGDRLMFLRNERKLGAEPGGRDGVAVKNGTLGTVLAVEAGGERLRVRLDGAGGVAGTGAGQEGRNAGSRVVTFSLRDYEHVDHGYAATIHKAQGVTVDRAHVLASEHMDRHAAYVALTRHRDGVELHWSAEALGDRAGLRRTLGRERLKDTSLDYGLDAGPGPSYGAAYAERRGVDPLRPESAIVVPQPGLEMGQRPKQASTAPTPAAAKPVPVSAAELAERVAQGQARFLDRFEARQRQLAEKAANEASARELVGRWDQAVTGFAAVLPRLDTDPAYRPARMAMLEFGRDLEAQPGAVAMLRERGDAFGMGERQTLARVVADAQPERAVGVIVETAETRIRAQLQEQAQQRAAQDAARQQELDSRPRQTLSRGPSMGM
jgi:Ti-type conjugative transfer relaxase TraA